MTEIWKPIPRCPGYEASSLGRVRSVDRLIITSRGVQQHLSGVLPKQKINPQTRYMQVCVRRDNRSQVTVRVNILVLEAFVRPRPSRMVCRHLNDVRDDNRIENLAWGTSKQNSADVVDHGRHPHANKTHCPQGHPYDEVNTYRVAARRGRFCATCHRARARAKVRAAEQCKKGHVYPPEIQQRIHSGEQRRYCPTCIANRKPRRDRIKENKS